MSMMFPPEGGRRCRLPEDLIGGKIDFVAFPGKVLSELNEKYSFLLWFIPDSKMHTCRFWLKQSREGVTIDAVLTLLYLQVEVVEGFSRFF
jgi:hypothetical protein